MANDHGIKVQFPIRLDDESGELEFQLGPEVYRRYHFPGRIRLSIFENRFQFWDHFYTYNIFKLCQELDRICRTCQGSARLYDWDWNEILCFSAFSGRNSIVVGGRIDPVCFVGIENFSETNFLASRTTDPREQGICSFFDGFLIDPSDLEQPIMAMLGFLKTNEAYPENPDSDDFDWSRIPQT